MIISKNFCEKLFSKSEKQSNSNSKSSSLIFLILSEIFFSSSSKNSLDPLFISYILQSRFTRSDRLIVYIFRISSLCIASNKSPVEVTIFSLLFFPRVDNTNILVIIVESKSLPFLIIVYFIISHS